MYDVIIIGAGPSGISASLYTQRGNLNTLVIYNEDDSNLQKAKSIENYYGFENGIQGKDLFNQGINQANKLGVEIKKDEVLKIEMYEKSFIITTANKEYKSKAVIIATGNKKTAPNIKGVKEFEGKGISYCAICDGFFYKNKNVAVLGNGNYAISETNDLINIANKITILTNGKEKPEVRGENIEINDKKIREVRGEEKLQEIEFEDNTNIKIDGMFIAEGTAGSIEFAKKLGIVTKQDKIEVNENMETNIPGVFACGDCTGGLYQISKAVYEGTKAGLQAIEYIKRIK